MCKEAHGNEIKYTTIIQKIRYPKLNNTATRCTTKLMENFLINEIR